MKTIAKLFVVVLFVALTLCGCVEKPSGSLVFQTYDGDGYSTYRYDLQEKETSLYTASEDWDSYYVFSSSGGYLVGLNDGYSANTVNVTFLRDTGNKVVTVDVPEGARMYPEVWFEQSTNKDLFMLMSGTSPEGCGTVYVYKVDNDLSINPIGTFPCEEYGKRTGLMSPDMQKMLVEDWFSGDSYITYTDGTKEYIPKGTFPVDSIIASTWWLEDGFVSMYETEDKQPCLSFVSQDFNDSKLRCYGTGEFLSGLLSPNGKKVALSIATPEGIRLIVVDVSDFGNPKSIEIPNDFINQDILLGKVWSPDGKYLALKILTKYQMESPNAQGFYIVPTDGSDKPTLAMEFDDPDSSLYLVLVGWLPR